MTTILAESWLAAAMLHEAEYPAVSPAQLVEEVQRGFADVRPGVHTRVRAHCMALTPKNTTAPHNYLIRTDSGDYRLDRSPEKWAM